MSECGKDVLMSECGNNFVMSECGNDVLMSECVRIGSYDERTSCDDVFWKVRF